MTTCTPLVASTSKVVPSTLTSKSIATRAASLAIPVIEPSVDKTSSPRLVAIVAASCHSGSPAASVPKTLLASVTPAVPILSVVTPSSAICTPLVASTSSVAPSTFTSTFTSSKIAVAGVPVNVIELAVELIAPSPVKAVTSTSNDPLPN